MSLIIEENGDEIIDRDYMENLILLMENAIQEEKTESILEAEDE